jgi:hypothetical protein
LFKPDSLLSVDADRCVVSDIGSLTLDLFDRYRILRPALPSTTWQRTS